MVEIKTIPESTPQTDPAPEVKQDQEAILKAWRVRRRDLTTRVIENRLDQSEPNRAIWDQPQTPPGETIWD
ncbi:hypothetical protein HOG48_05850 [Candidatus Peregrinibacteria bacterium]|jgi:hypothetical protein|nr:hypothetical protein [Candidatus Peregrinibacteria bacterium]